jgi:glycosyltransferase involved in cell wall biosynthesis
VNRDLIALDLTAAHLGRAGPHVYTTRLARALEPLLGERLRCISSRLAVPPSVPRRTADRLRTLGRDLWWHQIGVGLAARRAGCGLLHLPATLGPARPGIPTVVTIHDLALLHFPGYFPPWPRAYARVVLPRAARAARAVIAVSAATRKDVVEGLGVDERRVAVVPNGVDPVFNAAAAESPRAAEVWDRLRLPAAFALAVGTVEPRKNLARVLEAVWMLRARPETADVTLVHAGPTGWLAGDVERRVRDLSLGEGIRFLGYVAPADLAVLYGLARVCVYPSLYEGFGLPVAEAMACGCPVVTSNVSSLPEVAGDAAVLVDPLSVDEIAEATGALWRDEGRRRDLRARGLARALAFTWERTARETATVYDAALA